MNGLRVLDLTTCRAEMAGRLLADLGAEVLKIESPAGAEARRRPPFERTDPDGDPDGNPDEDPESLYWASVGRGKKSAVLNLDSDADRNLLCKLAERADVFIESFDPGFLRAIDLGYEALSAQNPRLIYASVTPYGQSGPKAGWPATELTIEAAGGRIALQGDPDRAPLPMGFPHSAFHAGAQAAADIVIALNERALSHRGQRLDTSMQESMVWTLMGPYGWPIAMGCDPPGTAEDRGDPAALLPMARLFPRLCECADGWLAVAMSPLGQSKGGGILPQIMRELRAAEDLDPTLAAVDWDDWEAAFREDRIPEETLILAVERTEEVLRGRTKQELVEWTIQHKLRLGAIRTTKDLLEDPHLAKRGFFEIVGGRKFPGLPTRFTTPDGERLEPAPLEPAPRLGQDQHRVAAWLSEPRPRAHRVEAERLGEAFDGLRVADFSWVVAGPTIGKAMADHGAQVVRVESSLRPDLARRLPPMKDDVEGLNRGQWAAMFNSSKHSLALDLSLERGRELARRLAAWADVVIESFSPGTMNRLGLGWETLSADREDLIMLSTSLFGSGGPLSPFVGYGQQAAAMVGLHAITGWPDRPPCGPWGPYTDVIAPKFGICALAAAILQRRRSGQGQLIELSQGESGIRFIEPLLLDEAVNGRTATARGMTNDLACPHGVYGSREKQRYIAIAVETQAEWRSLLQVAEDGSNGGRLILGLADARLDSLEARIGEREAIEEAMERWCMKQDAWKLEERLVSAGVPASVVQRPTDLYADPHLDHRGFRQTLDHSELGPMLYDGFATRFSAKKTMLHRASPCLGEHTRIVLHEFLGMSAQEIEELEAAGVLN